jgi:ATPase family protein associated with various cellular activities (AAA)/winged helix domain-containing protein
MSGGAGWHARNEQYLSSAVAWLRLRLTREADAAAVSADDLANARAAMDAVVTDDFTPGLVGLSRRLGLTGFEQDILLLCAAMELDTRIPALCARAQDDIHRPYPTFALALALFDAAAWEALAPTGPLRYWRLIEISQPAGQPLIGSALRADERVVHYIKGLNYLDDRLAPLVAPPAVEPGVTLPPSQLAIAERIVRDLERSSPPPLIQLSGSDGSSKQLVAGHAASAFGLHVHRLRADLLAAHAGDLDLVARLWERESRLLPVALYVDASDADRTGSPSLVEAVNRFLARTTGVVFLDTREPWPSSGRPSCCVDVSKPRAHEQRDAWAGAAELASDDGAGLLASQFNLSVSSIRQIVRHTEPIPTDVRTRQEQLWRACVSETRPRMDALARRLEPRATWDDMVLPQAEVELLRQIAVHVRQRSRVYDSWGFRSRMNRGLGISALFTGESGTGKTMAAEVIAAELQLDLFRVDLSAVISKYIGETEKNLCRLFDAAEDGGSILFFDEADALFGRRSEVRDSHDRYANIEINYLLQRMEAYRGLAILATNMKSALDRAFVRRLRFIVSFPFPGVAERKAIWRKAFPAATPLSPLDCDWLARFNFTGGSIHNVALNAAFLAASRSEPVSMPIVVEAVRVEMGKLEKPINETELRWKADREQAVPAEALA